MYNSTLRLHGTNLASEQALPSMTLLMVMVVGSPLVVFG